MPFHCEDQRRKQQQQQQKEGGRERSAYSEYVLYVYSLVFVTDLLSKTEGPRGGFRLACSWILPVLEFHDLGSQLLFVIPPYTLPASLFQIFPHMLGLGRWNLLSTPQLIMH